MEFGADNCAEIIFEKEKLVQSQNLIPDIKRKIQEFERGKAYLPGDWGQWSCTSTNKMKIKEEIISLSVLKYNSDVIGD